MNNRDKIAKAKRIVIKIGSSSLTHKETGHINIANMEKFVRQVADIKHSGKEVVVVSSGAIAVGLSALHMNKRPDCLADKQAVAAVGQASLMMIYDKLFREYNQVVGQILITKDLIEDQERKNNAINTFHALFGLDVIPIVNENDTISTEEIEFGDNDNLSAIVACLIEADLLIILTDIDGLYDADPRVNANAQLIHEVNIINQKIEGMASGAGSKVGTGGMVTKVQAAKLANKYGIDTIIANANQDRVLYKIIQSLLVGTVFYAS